MSVCKRGIFVLGISIIGILVFSISAFAYDVPQDEYNFVLDSYPMHVLDNSNNVQSFSYFIQNTDYEVLYCEVIINKNSGSRPIDFTNCYVTVGSLPVDNNYRFVPMAWLTQAFSGYGFNLPTKMYFYDESGTLVQEFSFNTGGTAAVGLYYNTNWFGNGTSIDRFSLMYDGLRFYCPSFPSTFTSANSEIMSHWTTGYPDYLLGFYNVVSPDEQFDSTIEGKIYVNGQLVYGSGGGGGNVASSIIGSAIGNLIPEYDENGNITNIITNNTFEFDITPFTESDGNQPDPWDNSSIDDYNSSNEDVQDSISDFKGQFAFSDVFGDDFDLTSFRGAMTFWKDRFDEVMDFNPVFPVLITTSLTLGLVAVILGRKLGVG